MPSPYYPDAEAMWNLFTTGFGPVRALSERLKGRGAGGLSGLFQCLLREIQHRRRPSYTKGLPAGHGHWEV